MVANLSGVAQGQDYLPLSTDAFPILISFFDANHVCRFANEYHTDWYGRTPEELTGQHMVDFLGEEAYQTRLPYLNRVAAGEEVLFEAPVPFLDGTWHDAEIRYIPQLGRRGFEGFHILVVDIARQRHRFRSVFDGTALGFFEIDLLNLHSLVVDLKARGIVDLAGYAASNSEFIRQVMDLTLVTDINQKAMEMFGLNRETAIGRPLGDWCPPESLNAWNNTLISYFSGKKSYEAETVMRRKDGSYIDVLLNCAFPERTEGQVIVVIGLVDITQRLAGEKALVKAHQELAHAARVATLGELTASIAHEVNQPLAAVVTNGLAALRWLDRPAPNLEESKAAINRMIDEATRASQIITRTRNMAKNAASERTVLPIGSIIGEAVEITGRQLRSLDSSLQLSLDAAGATVLVDRIQIQQVIINLLMNAAQAMSDASSNERVITLSCSVRNEMLEIKVSDTGPGIPDRASQQLFNAFYTTKSTGMGMGLSISRSIVEAHGGEINAENGTAGGAIFIFTIPTATSAQS
jgi:PAS domain S-box-containing protein